MKIFIGFIAVILFLVIAWPTVNHVFADSEDVAITHTNDDSTERESTSFPPTVALTRSVQLELPV